jgi:predicted RNA methylase
MKKWELEERLRPLEGFRRPRMPLEQYATPAEIAAELVWAMQTRYGDVAGRRVLDLGCGPGMLGVACALLGAAAVLGVDVDADALNLARENARAAGVAAPLELLRHRVAAESPLPLRPGACDVVVMNPPFGTKTAGADVLFLDAALAACPAGPVYSLHKSSTRAYIARRAHAAGRRDAEVVAQVRFPLPKSYRCHKKDEVDVAVDFWRFD